MNRRNFLRCAAGAIAAIKAAPIVEVAALAIGGVAVERESYHWTPGPSYRDVYYSSDGIAWIHVGEKVNCLTIDFNSLHLDKWTTNDNQL